MSKRKSARKSKPATNPRPSAPIDRADEITADAPEGTISPEQFDLIDHVNHLRSVARGEIVDQGAHEALLAIVETIEPDISPEHVPMYERAMAAFDAMTEKDRRAALNGWNPSMPCLSRADMQAAIEGTAIGHGVEINVGDKGPSADFASWFSDTTGMLQVQIPVGMTRDVAIKSLTQVLTLVVDKWPVLVDRPDDLPE